MFVENGHKKTFLKLLVKDYNARKKTNGSRNYSNSKKILTVPNIRSKIRKELTRTYKVSYVKTTEATT